MKFTEAVKAATRVAHRQTERVAFAREIGRKSLLPVQYQQLLIKNHYIFAQLEQAIDQFLLAYPTITFPQTIDYHRTPSLQRELQARKLIPYPDFTEILPPKITAEEDALGALYVMEGSKLGGRMILRMLEDNPHFEGNVPFYFYENDRNTIGSNWPLFCQYANAKLHDAKMINRAIDTAEKTFLFFKRVYEVPLPTATSAH